MDHRSLNLTSKPKLSKLGRPYRLSAIVKNLQVPSKWINKVEHWHWFYFFIYTDDNSFFGFEFDYYDKFVQKFNHEQSLKLFKNG
jgi:hypothetical protein